MVDAVARAHAGVGPGAAIPRAAMTAALTLGFTLTGMICLAATLASARRVRSVDPAPAARE
jgi:hypothetical protein